MAIRQDKNMKNIRASFFCGQPGLIYGDGFVLIIIGLKSLLVSCMGNGRDIYLCA